MRHFHKTTSRKKPKTLTLTEMWALYHLLEPAEPIRVVTIIQKVPPRQIEQAMQLLYGSSDVVTSGIGLLDHLYRGLEHNYFNDFLASVRRPR